MTSMLMADTNKSDEWIQRALAAYPMEVAPSGNIRTCPVRVQFVKIAERGKPQPGQEEGSYGCVMIFPKGADLSVLKSAIKTKTLEKWPDAGKKGGPKLKMPLKVVAETYTDGDGDEIEDEVKRFGGFIDGATYANVTSKKYQPQAFDANGRELKDLDKLYNGAWVIVTINPFNYDAGTNKGTSLGIQAIQLVADDQKLGGGGGNSAGDFKPISLDASVNTADVFGDNDDGEDENALFA